MTLDQALERAEDSRRVALAIYSEMRELRELGLWNRARNQRYVQMEQLSHAMSFRYADLRAEAMRIEATARQSEAA